MHVPSDIEIAQSCQMRPIGEIAAAAGSVAVRSVNERMIFFIVMSGRMNRWV